MSKKIIIAGGGTGGHIFPAIAIANALTEKDMDIQILFIGAKGKMEMQKIPEAGYTIEGIDITGFNRSSLIKNIALPAKLIKSFFQVRRIFKNFKPDAVIGVGGYSTFPVLKQAQAQGIPTFIHESNSFAGKANKMLGKNAEKIFTGTDGMTSFFPENKVVVTGNPVRKQITNAKISKKEALAFFGFDEGKKTLLVVGGSLGARSINDAIVEGIDELMKAGLQIIWQTGKTLTAEAEAVAAQHKNVWANPFITKMELAYAAADIIIARAGAMTVAEICVVQKPVIFVPYPFAAEDHQKVNALKLVEKGAAEMVSDGEAKNKVVNMAIDLVGNDSKCQKMMQNLSKLSITNADERIADEILKTIK